MISLLFDTFKFKHHKLSYFLDMSQNSVINVFENKELKDSCKI